MVDGGKPDVAVLGGGPAGAATAVRLAASGYDVVLFEKTASRAHKLCGEFISPEVVAAFESLGVLEDVLGANAVTINRLRLTAASGSEYRARLPASALALSRAVLDEIMLARATAVGVTVRRGVRVRDVAGDAEDGFQVLLDDQSRWPARFVVGAFGKRSSLDGTMKRKHLSSHSPWVAFKAHYRGIDIGDAVELHVFHRGYCGLSMVEDGTLNACWIMHMGDLKSIGGLPEDVPATVFASNAALQDRFASIDRVFSRFNSAGQLSFVPRGCFAGDVVLVGDAAGMISPLCGDGIAMAIESSRLMSNGLAEVLAGRLQFGAFREEYGRKWNSAFANRMRIGHALQRMLMNKHIASASIRLANLIPSLGAAMMRATRGALP